MQEHDFQLLRGRGTQLVPLATILCLGTSPRQAMDRAALALNINPTLAPDVLVLHAQPNPPALRILPGDILTGGGITCRVLDHAETTRATHHGQAVNLT